jgi:hypothetical protein
MNVAYAGDFWPRPSWRQRQQTMVFADSVSEPVTVAPPVVSPPTTASLPLWLEPTLSRMRELSALGRDWDRRGSAAVRQDALQFAYSVLMEVMAPTTPAPSIVPLGHGGVQLLWKSPSAERSKSCCPTTSSFTTLTGRPARKTNRRQRPSSPPSLAF